MRIVFFNISYMKYYKGKEDDTMVGNFRYVREKGDGGEKHNFAPWVVNGKEVCYGFVEPGFTKGEYENGRQRKMHIQKIKDATVYRNVNLLPYDKDTDRGLPEFGY